jgi:transcriptional regulator with XRE-family HTH domain
MYCVSRGVCLSNGHRTEFTFGAGRYEAVTFGELLRQIRLQGRLTQFRLACKIGVSQATVSRWENDHDRPTRPQLRLMESALDRPIIAREYIDVTLPQVINTLLQSGETPIQEQKNPPPELAIVRGKMLVAAPFLLKTAETVRNASELIDCWVKTASPNIQKDDISMASWAIRDAVAKVVVDEGTTGVPIELEPLDARYLEFPLKYEGATGVLQQNLELGVLRPILPRTLPQLPRASVAIGPFIPIARKRVSTEPIPKVQGLLNDPVCAAMMLLVTCPRFPSINLSTKLLDTATGFTISVDDGVHFWEGQLSSAVIAVLRVTGFVCFTPFGRNTWAQTIRSAANELVNAGLLRASGPCLDVGEHYWSEIAATPSHRLNKGEKRARERVGASLLSYLKAEHK